MPRLNLKSIARRVNSHIIDYRAVMRILKRNWFLFFLCCASLGSTLVVSPFTTIYLVTFFSLYFFYRRQYENIFLIWFFFLFNWYLIITFFFVGFDGPILIGYSHTGVVFFYLVDTPFLFPFFRDFCLETVVVFDVVANYFGITIWIPSIFKGLLGLVKVFQLLVEYIFGRGRGGSSA